MVLFFLRGAIFGGGVPNDLAVVVCEDERAVAVVNFYSVHRLLRHVVVLCAMLLPWCRQPLHPA
jgi:hypothetical protein